jgi:hypothetical protein
MPAAAVRAKILALTAVAGLCLAACGGAAATSGPGAGGGGATQGTGAATQNPGGGGQTQQPGGGQTVDACAFLTDDDIKSVTGYAVATKKNGAQVGIFQSGCEWELVAPNEIVPPSIVLGIMVEGGKAYYEKYMKPYNDEQGATAVPVGDEAVDAGFSVIMGVKGDAFFNLQYLGQKDWELELAKKLVTHL